VCSLKVSTLIIIDVFPFPSTVCTEVESPYAPPTRNDPQSTQNPFHLYLGEIPRPPPPYILMGAFFRFVSVSISLPFVAGAALDRLQAHELPIGLFVGSDKRTNGGI
jgi:hypothetical protein